MSRRKLTLAALVVLLAAGVVLPRLTCAPHLGEVATPRELHDLLTAAGLEYEGLDNTGTREIRAMPMLHPAYLLRSPIAKRLAWRDMLAIKKALG